MLIFKKIILQYIKFIFNCLKKKIYLLGFIIFIFACQDTAFSKPCADYNWFWFFYENERTDRMQSFVIRPFFMKNKNLKNGDIFKASLMPIVYWEYQTKRKSEWKSLFGFINSVDYVHKEGTKDYDLGVFPFLFYGDSKDERDKYCLIWPFGGTLKGKLGQDRISAYIFPGIVLFFFFPPTWPPTLISTLRTAAILAASFMPVYTEYEFKDYSAMGFFWPIIQRGKSKERDDLRILPFYAHNYYKNKYDNYSVLMIFNYQKTFFSDDEQRTIFAFPFYGRRWNLSSSSNSSSLLWPFFSWGYDTKRGDYELNFPWPLVQIQDCMEPQIRKRIFFPFYGEYEYRDQESLFVTPLYFSLKKHSVNFDSEYYIISVLFWYFKREYKNHESPEYGTSWRYFKIWPLMQYEYDDRENFSFNLFSFFPMRDPEGYEKLYQPFWTILEYRRFKSGEKRMGLICRIYYQRWGKDFLNIKIAPLLFSYDSSNGMLNNLSFLFSMFGYNNNYDERYIKIFWIPISIGVGSSKGKEQCKNQADVKNSDKRNEPHYYARGPAWPFENAFDFKVRNNSAFYTIRVF